MSTILLELVADPLGSAEHILGTTATNCYRQSLTHLRLINLKHEDIFLLQRVWRHVLTGHDEEVVDSPIHFTWTAVMLFIGQINWMRRVSNSLYFLLEATFDGVTNTQKKYNAFWQLIPRSFGFCVHIRKIIVTWALCGQVTGRPLTYTLSSIDLLALMWTLNHVDDSLRTRYIQMDEQESTCNAGTGPIELAFPCLGNDILDWAGCQLHRKWKKEIMI
jgi:hypothetical protein